MKLMYHRGIDSFIISKNQLLARSSSGAMFFANEQDAVEHFISGIIWIEYDNIIEKCIEIFEFDTEEELVDKYSEYLI